MEGRLNSELKVDVPLASKEDLDDDTESVASTSASVSPRPSSSSTQQQKPVAARRPPLPASVAAAAAAGKHAAAQSRSSSASRSRASPRFNLDDDSAAGSLEDLVNSFDEKITKVFQDYQENVSKIAPVQVRSQEEIMNECQVWWTITGNFGNMMPIDWSKSTARAKHLPTLNLSAAQTAGADRLDKPQTTAAAGDEGEEDDIVAADLDMHALILNSNPAEGTDRVKSAEEVIQEIDDMIEADEEKAAAEQEDEQERQQQQSSSSKRYPPGGPFSSCQRSSRMVSEALAGRRLEELSTNELTQILSDVELLVRELSEELVADLGVRDELEYEKELKNTFISLLLSIQSKRRQHQAAGGRTRRDPRDPYKYLTTVIPYQPDRGAPPVSSLQVLVKILKAINEDSPAVPALLTDYILKVLCPS